LTDVFFFCLSILDWIESPTAVVIPRIYSNNDINSAPAASSQPAIAANSLAPWYTAGSPAAAVPDRLLRLPRQAT
jgi:hypothetical protein